MSPNHYFILSLSIFLTITLSLFQNVDSKSVSTFTPQEIIALEKVNKIYVFITQNIVRTLILHKICAR